MILVVLVAAFIGSVSSDITTPLASPDCRSILKFEIANIGPYAYFDFPFDGNPEQVISVKAQVLVPSGIAVEPLMMKLVNRGINKKAGSLMATLILPMMATSEGTEIDINGMPFCQNYEPAPVEGPGLTLTTLNRTFKIQFKWGIK